MSTAMLNDRATGARFDVSRKCKLPAQCDRAWAGSGESRRTVLVMKCGSFRGADLRCRVAASWAFLSTLLETNCSSRSYVSE